MDRQSIERATREVVRLLVDGNYGELERLSAGKRLTANQIAEGVREYGRRLVMPPNEAFESLDVEDVDGSQPTRHGVRLCLWTAEEGKSDLTLEITVSESAGDRSYNLEIDDLHVL